MGVRIGSPTVRAKLVPLAALSLKASQLPSCGAGISHEARSFTAQKTLVQDDELGCGDEIKLVPARRS